jgi:surfeit locus 1 family protein
LLFRSRILQALPVNRSVSSATGEARSAAWLYAFVVLAIALSALFIRLGFWQLDRREERRADNAARRVALEKPAVPFAQLRDNEAPERHTVVEGTPDYDNEFVHAGRSRNGSPGVHILTPVQIAGDGTAVLVNRGWVYAADAATVDLARWREKRTVFRGYSRQMPPGDSVTDTKGRGLRTLAFTSAQRLVPYPIHPRYVVSLDSASEGSPARLPAPVLNDGPHLGYAVQWFCFAAIALFGAAIVVHRSRKPDIAGATGA